MQSRTHTCGQLRLENAGEKVTLCGWMENVRVVGQNFAFVVLRDFYGTTQIVVETEQMMNIIKSLNKESTIQVVGTVRERDLRRPHGQRVSPPPRRAHGCQRIRHGSRHRGRLLEGRRRAVQIDHRPISRKAVP